MSAMKCSLLAALLVGLALPASSRDRQSKNAQTQTTPSSSQSTPPPKSSTPASTNNPAQQSATAAGPVKNSPADAWDLLMQGANSTKFRDRSDAVSALTVLDRDHKAIAVISNALDDKEETIRVLAATSLGDIKARSAIPRLRKSMNDDKSPQVSFAAAQALWKMGDRSGRDVFYDVLDGERKVHPGLIKSKMHEARMEMHDPKALALIGVNQVSGAFLGPFSMGVSMVEEYAKNTGTSVQALCAQLLALDDSHDTVEELAYALGDKNWTVRAAAARSLAKLNIRKELPELKDMMVNDKSQPARFAAAAAVLALTNPRIGATRSNRTVPSVEPDKKLKSEAETVQSN